jgi:hypothetical protein
MESKIYDGPLNLRTMPPLEKKAYEVFRGQRKRCRNPKTKSYKTYGAKGICVEYGAREFISWYVPKFKSTKWECAHVGRLDHSRSYSFNNIEMIERSENIKERNTRLPQRRRPVLALKDGEKMATFFSSFSAAKILGFKQGHIFECAQGKRKKIKGYEFKFLENKKWL